MPASRPRSWAILVLSTLVSLQGLALIAAAALTLVDPVVGQDPAPEGSGWVIAVCVAGIAVFVAAALLLAARGLYRARRWARAPVFVVQLIIGLVVAGPGGVLSAGFWHLGVPLLLWALAVTVLLFLPATFLVDESSHDDSLVDE